MSMEKNPQKFGEEEVKKAIESRDASKLMGTLSDNERNMLNYYLNNKQAREELLSSEKAKALLKTLLGK